MQFASINLADFLPVGHREARQLCLFGQKAQVPLLIQEFHADHRPERDSK
jgi:hypothetical protein